MKMVRCNYCGQPYDLHNVEIKARYADATVFTTPCCGKQADDRTWVSLPSFSRDAGEHDFNEYGRLVRW